MKANLTNTRIAQLRRRQAMLSAQPKIVRGRALREYLLEYATPSERAPHLWTVHKDLPVFKKARDRSLAYSVIVNMELLCGSVFHARPQAFTGASTVETRKMRADSAYVHSIAYADPRSISHLEAIGTETRYARSCHDMNFYYEVGETVRPSIGFNRFPGICSTGIHFFLNVRDAIQYS